VNKPTYLHPLEEILGIESGSTLDIESEYAVAPAPAQALPAVVEKDEEDVEVDKKIDTVYDAALAAFKNQTEYTEIIEPRYAARNAEVAANYLNIALNAAATRARVKTERKRANTFVPFNNGGGKTTNNLIVADRNEILRMIQVDDRKEETK
jgi:hypothetical protein